MWQLVINTATSVLAFLLVALLQNSERRNDAALHRKLDAQAQALADVMDHPLSGDRDALRRSVERLRSTVGVEDRI